MNSLSSLGSLGKKKKKSKANRRRSYPGNSQTTSMASLRLSSTSTGTGLGSKDSSCADSFVLKAEQALKEEKEVHRLVSAADLQIVGRDDELETLKASLLGVSSGKRVRVISITGQSGTGKSSLVQELARNLSQMRAANGMCICSGKYTQADSGLAGCIQDLVHQIHERDVDKTIQKKLQSCIRPQDAAVLMETFPSLSLLFGNHAAGGSTSETDKTRRAKQRQFLFFQLIETIINTRTSQTQLPALVMILDDTQWADGPSMELISAVVRDPDLDHFVLVTTSRPCSEQASNPYLHHLHRWSNQDNLPIQSLHLDNLKEPQVHLLVEQLLDSPLDPSTTAPLASIVYSKTQGNPFFTIEFLKRLVEEGLVKYSFTKLQWDYDIQRITSSSVDAGNAIDLVKGRLQKLPPRYQLLLMVAACLGASFHQPLLATILNQLDIHDDPIDIESSLNACVDLGLLQTCSNNDHDVFFFVHDLVKEAALAFGTPNENEFLKLRVGKCILQQHDHDKMESLLFVGVDLCNHSAPMLLHHNDTQHWIDLAHYNRSAGQKAMREGAHGLSLHYTETGIHYLDSHDISMSEQANTLLLNLLADAAEAVYCCENYNRIYSYTNRVLNTLACPDETELRMKYLLILSSCAQEKPEEAIDIAREAIHSLGATRHFPKNPSMALVTVELIKTKMLLRNHTEDSLLALPMMTDERRIMATRFIDGIQAAAYMVRPYFGNITFFRALRWTVKYGISEYSPIQFTIWGFLNHTIFGDGEANVMYSEVALKLAEKLDIRETTSKTSMLCFSMSRHWSIEARACYPPIEYAHKLAMEGGDTTTAVQCNIFMDFVLWCTAMVPLQQLGRKLEDHRRFAKECKHQAMLNATTGMALSLRRLCLQDDNGFVWLQDPDVSNAIKAPDAATQGLFDVADLQVRYMLGDTHEAQRLAKKTKEIGSKLNAGQVYVSRTHFYRALVFLEAAHMQRARVANLRAAKKAMGLLKRWIDGGDLNCRHMFCLLEAETAKVKGKVKLAMDLYTEAIRMSHQSEHVQDAAVSEECAGVFYLELGDESRGAHHLHRACKNFNEWGASEKVKRLLTEHKKLLACYSSTVPSAS